MTQTINHETTIDTPQIVTTEPQHYASLYLKVPTAEVRKHMGAGLNEVREVLAAQGVEASGPWFTHHFVMPTDIFDYEICIPVAAPIAAAGRVKPAVWPAMKVVRTVHHGDYSLLGAAWGGFMAWIGEQKLQVAGDLWEVYSIDPSVSADPASWRTEMIKPLKA